jgi:predicted small lipoprotein YifL
MRLAPLLVSLSLLLAGCGYKGDLYLPPPGQEQPKPASQPEQKQEQRQ